jgi:hypothetical protein
MKYITFWRESNKFSDILSDTVLKKVVKFKISWNQYLLIGIDDYDRKNAQVISYITLKYGDDMKSEVVPDRTPIPGVDYVPKR